MRRLDDCGGGFVVHRQYIAINSASSETSRKIWPAS
jgi:hypothetical protein